jgi:TonB family protein
MRAALLLFVPLLGLSGESGHDVQAFIPNLPWVNRIEPVWPAGARSQGIQGHVELLVTLNSNGRVTHTEPLSGPSILRQAAMDAVAQWEFRPVIRNGHPVSAMTTEAVTFFTPGQKIAPEDLGGLDEQKAAAKRIYELTSKYPRSNDQILADLEQATAAAVGQQRFYYLQGLAEAAFDAVQFDKAEAYAKELLSQPDSPKDWNYGNAVFYGNMVLGRVALNRDHQVESAKTYLLAAGRTPGSPQLNSFGPNMSLAKDLLLAGERDAVLDFFTSCRAFWKLGAVQLDNWTAAVKAGEVPNFGANLKY